MSRPSEPVETVSTSIDLSFLPSRMIEPLPKLRSIWESAASRAFDLSIGEPSTRRSAVAIAPTPYDGESQDRQRMVRELMGSNVHDLFSVRNMFSEGNLVLAPGQYHGNFGSRHMNTGSNRSAPRLFDRLGSFRLHWDSSRNRIFLPLPAA